MRNTNRFFGIVVFAVIIGFVYGASRLVLLEFETGRAYPPYSTFRSDLLGAKGLYEAFEGLSGLRVSRNVEPFSKLGGNHALTLFLVGLDTADPDEVPAEIAREFERLMLNGSRVVVAFAPVGIDIRKYDLEMLNIRTRSREKREEDNDAESKAESEAEGESVDEEEEQEGEKVEEESGLEIYMEPAVVIKDRWGIELQFDPLQHGEFDSYEPVTVRYEGSEGLPSRLPWHSALYFDLYDPSWSTLYSRDGRAVLAERSFGDGSLVFCSDSYYLSNEALIMERQPKLLAWFSGPHSTIVFDETHLGTASRPGIMWLARKHGLHGLFGVLLVIALLFIWRNTMSLVPPHDDDLPRDAAAVTAGRDSAGGFHNLVRRSVPPRELLDKCVDEWNRSFGHRKDTTVVGDIDRIAAAERNKTPKAWNPVNAYREICRAIQERK